MSHPDTVADNENSPGFRITRGAAGYGFVLEIRAGERVLSYIIDSDSTRPRITSNNLSPEGAWDFVQEILEHNRSVAAA